MMSVDRVAVDEDFQASSSDGGSASSDSEGEGSDGGAASDAMSEDGEGSAKKPVKKKQKTK